jgi:D-alanine-D-alanine ligase
MNISVDDNWWQNAFDATYLLTDARSVCNEELTRREVDLLINTLKIDKAAHILDLCGGQGRHAIELARRGFKNLTVLDYSAYLIGVGREMAEAAGLDLAFLRGDARDTCLPSSSFDCIIVMASSFGYFLDEEDNKRILVEAFRLLTLIGTLLLDLPDRDYVIHNFQPSSCHAVSDDITVSRERELGKDIIYSRERVLSKQRGCIKESSYCTRLYSPEKITELLGSTGFSTIITTRDFMNREEEGDFGCMTNRMIVTARKNRLSP